MGPVEHQGVLPPPLERTKEQLAGAGASWTRRRPPGQRSRPPDRRRSESRAPSASSSGREVSPCYWTQLHDLTAAAGGHRPRSGCLGAASPLRQRDSLTTSRHGLCAVGAWLRPLPRSPTWPCPWFVRSAVHRIEPSRGPKDAALPIRSHAIVRPPAAVTLTAENGSTVLASMKAGVEIEVTAWRPRRSGPALYRVRARNGGEKGWTTSASLERLPPPPPPSPPRNASPVAGPPAKRVAAKSTTRTRRGARAR
jgi:hypothetical protein